MHLTAPSHWSRSIVTSGRDPSERVVTIVVARSVIYGTRRGGPSQAQAHAFKDMWTWGPDAKNALNGTAERHLEAGALLDSFQKVFPDSNMLAYLAMMGVRLIEMQRVLKPTGSLYLHCDPTASHYLKILLDSIFGPKNFRNEIIWKRTSAHSAAERWADVHDVLLFYTKSDSYIWNKIFTDYDDEYKQRYKNIDEHGRQWADDNLTAPGKRGGDSGEEWRGFNPTKKSLHWKVSHNAVVDLIGEKKAAALTTREKLDVLDKHGLIHWPRGSGFPRFKRVLGKGRPLQDIILDIPPLNSQAQERLGYSTQKPLALLRRIIEASSNEGDVVLDPFCGCGTAIEAAEELHREWVGIDVTYLAIHVIEGRLVKAFGPEIKARYQLFGRPKDADDARALAARDWLEFQKWAVFALGGLPKDKPGADGGIDGIIRYHRVGIEQPNRAVVSVKGGEHVGVDAIHKLKSVVQREKAEIGILVCLDGPTRAMEKEILSEGDVGPQSRRVPKLQVVTVDEIFSKQPIDLPGTIDPPEITRLAPPMSGQKRRTRKIIEGQTEMLFALDNPQVSYEAEKPRKKGRQIRPVDIEVIRPDTDRKAK